MKLGSNIKGANITLRCKFLLRLGLVWQKNDEIIDNIYHLDVLVVETIQRLGNIPQDWPVGKYFWIVARLGSLKFDQVLE